MLFDAYLREKGGEMSMCVLVQRVVGGVNTWHIQFQHEVHLLNFFWKLVQVEQAHL